MPEESWMIARGGAPAGRDIKPQAAAQAKPRFAIHPRIKLHKSYFFGGKHQFSNSTCHNKLQGTSVAHRFPLPPYRNHGASFALAPGTTP
jgi:hypothetical protein